MRVHPWLVGMVLTGTADAAATEIHVPGDYATIAEAIAAAPNGYTIVVAFGEYRETVPISVEGKTLTIRGEPGVVVRGSHGSGVADAPLLALGPGAVVALQDVELDGEDVLQLVQVEGATLTATNLYLHGAAGTYGATLDAVAGSTVTITTSVLAEATAIAGGALVHANSSTVSITGSVLDSANAPSGAVVWSTDSAVSITGSTIRTTTASIGSILEIERGSLALSTSTLLENVAAVSVIATDGASVVVDQDLFVRNTSGGPSLWLAAAPGSAEVKRNLFCDGDAGEGLVTFDGSAGRFANNVVRLGETVVGGIDAIDEGAVRTANNTFVGASAAGGGSTYFTYYGTIDSVNDVVAFANDGFHGPLWADAGAIELVYALVFQNVPTHADSVSLEGVGVLRDVSPGWAAPNPGTCTSRDLVPPVDSPLVDAGDPGILDADGTRSDLGATGGPEPFPLLEWADNDGDGWSAPGDCNDQNAAIYPFAEEIECSGVDEDCTSQTPDGADLDQDGVNRCTDCDDTDPAFYPGADEVCDGIDQDCDLEIDEQPVDGVNSYPDADGDGYGVFPPVRSCEVPPGHATVAGDCDDLDPLFHPGALDIGDDGIDQDCNGSDLDPTFDGAAGVSCGCRSDGGGFLPMWAGAALLLVRRRSRSSRLHTR